VTAKLRHQALTESHDLTLGLALRVEIRTALGASHHQAREGVLQDLLEAKELDDAQINCGVETDAALVGTEGAAELDAKTPVDAEIAFVVLPGNAEDDLPFRLDQAIDDPRPDVLRTPIKNRNQAVQHFLDRLMELRFAGVPSENLIVCFLYHRFRCHLSNLH